MMMTALPFLTLLGMFLTLMEGVIVVQGQQTIDDAQADFAWNLLEASGPQTHFIVLSPFSISIALAMVYAGAEGNTKTQIGNTIAKGVNNDSALIDYFSSAAEQMDKTTAGFQLNTANKVYIQDKFEILKSFENIIKQKFASEIQQVDFAANRETAELINAWVEKKTNSRIRNLVQPQMLSAQTAMALINAIYFKGDWKTKFNAESTTKKMFHAFENSDREVDMMAITSGFSYAETEDVQVLELPYKDPETFMYIFLPTERFGLRQFEKSMNGEKIMQLMNGCMPRNKIIVELPKFKLDGQLRLNKVLEELGIRDAFDAEKANFDGISKNDSLVVSDVVHKANVEVNEEGSEAAAATGLFMVFRSSRPMPMTPPIRFIADHPFIFTIVSQNRILFIGRFH